MEIFVIAVFSALLIIITCLPDRIIEENLLDGTISQIDNDSILVESTSGESPFYVAYMMGETVFKNISINQLSVGDNIKIEHTGQVLESMPIQVYCKTVWKEIV
ncbi:MAG: hypothetical protein KMY55_01635 [Dethiosulfatibacter sp.]|nr:hypothetical protein [Dethiosulfatibacter sp.]